jgi:hypothetical protein
MHQRMLLHEVWENFGDEGESLPCLLIAGRLCEQARDRLNPQAKLLTTFEAGSHFEAMTIYYRLMGWSKYVTDQPWDYQPYPDEWFDERNRG